MVPFAWMKLAKAFFKDFSIKSISADIDYKGITVMRIMEPSTNGTEVKTLYLLKKSRKEYNKAQKFLLKSGDGTKPY